MSLCSLSVWDFADFSKLSFEHVSNLSREFTVNTCTGSCKPSLWWNTLPLLICTASNFTHSRQTLHHSHIKSGCHKQLLEALGRHWTTKHRRTKSEPASAHVASFCIQIQNVYSVHRRLILIWGRESQVVLIYISWGYYEALGFPRQPVRRVARKHTQRSGVENWFDEEAEFPATFSFTWK